MGGLRRRTPRKRRRNRAQEDCEERLKPEFRLGAGTCAPPTRAYRDLEAHETLALS